MSSRKAFCFAYCYVAARLRSEQVANLVPAADDVALLRCANVATTGFCVILASLAERCYSN